MIEPALQHQIDLADEFARVALASTTWVHLFPDVPDLDARVVVAEQGPETRQLRGRKMRGVDQFFDEISAAWQFADYGTEIEDLDEGLSDLRLTWPTDVGFALVILDAEQVLIDDDRLRWAVETFDFIHQKYSVAVPGGAPSGRPALSFDVFLVTDEKHRDETVRRWTEAGAPLTD